MNEDHISRLAAIRVICEKSCLSLDPCGAECSEVIALKELPSAEPRWIPVTERLPEIGEKVLVSTKYTVFTQVFKRIYGTPDRWGWEHNTIKKVTAWMPLPKPWKGEADE